MKMDCEGCEYDAITNSKRVGEIKQIQIEHHCGPVRLLKALKNAGFEVKATKPKKYHNLPASDLDWGRSVGTFTLGRVSFPTLPLDCDTAERLQMITARSARHIIFLV